MRKLSNEMKKKIALVMAICLLCGSLSVFPRIARAEENNDPTTVGESVANTQADESVSGEEPGENKPEADQPTTKEEADGPSEGSGEKQPPVEEQKPGEEESKKYVTFTFDGENVDQDDIVIKDTETNVVKSDEIEKNKEYILVFTLNSADVQVGKFSLGDKNKIDDLKIVDYVKEEGDADKLRYEFKFKANIDELNFIVRTEDRKYNVLFEDESAEKSDKVVKDGWTLKCDGENLDGKVIAGKECEIEFSLYDENKVIDTLYINGVAVKDEDLKLITDIPSARYTLKFTSENKDVKLGFALKEGEKKEYSLEVNYDSKIKLEYTIYNSNDEKLDLTKDKICQGSKYSVLFDFDTYDYYLNGLYFDGTKIDKDNVVTIDGKKYLYADFKGKKYPSQSNGESFVLNFITTKVTGPDVSVGGIGAYVLDPLANNKCHYEKEGFETYYFKEKVTFKTKFGEKFSFDGKEYNNPITLTERTKIEAYFIKNSFGNVERKKLDKAVYVDFDNDPPKFELSNKKVFYRKLGEKSYEIYPNALNYDISDIVELKQVWWNHAEIPFDKIEDDDYKLGTSKNGYLYIGRCSKYNPEEPVAYLMAEDAVGNVSSEKVTNVLDEDEPKIVRVAVDGDTVSSQNGVLFAKNGLVKFWVYANDGEGSGINQTYIQFYDDKGTLLGDDKVKINAANVVDFSEADKKDETLKGCKKFEIVCETEDDTFSRGYLIAHAIDNVGNRTANGSKFDEKLVFNMYSPGISLAETPANTVKEANVEKPNEITLYYNPNKDAKSIDLVFNVTDIQTDYKKDDEEAPALESIEIWDGGNKITKIGNVDLSNLPDEYKHIYEGLTFNVELVEDKQIRVKALSTVGKIKDFVITLVPDEIGPSINAVTYKNCSFVSNDGIKYEAFDNNSICIDMSAFDTQSGTNKIAIDYIDYSSGLSVGTDTITVDNDCKVTYNTNTGIKLSKFKGYLKLTAEDNLENKSNPVMTKGFVIESKKDHENEEGHLSLAREDKGDDFIYNSAVKVPLTVVDNFAGIKDIEIVNDGNKKTSKDLEKDGWKIERDSCGLIVKATKTITVDEDKDDIEYSVKVTDNAGNTTEKTDVVSIDKTRPEISLSLSGQADEKYTSFYNTSRELTVTVKDRSFDKKLIETEIANSIDAKFSISSWEHNIDKKNPNESTHTATITLDKDADYEIKVSGKDKANNPAETVKTGKFTIDTTRPGLEAAPNGLTIGSDNFSKTTGYANIVITEPNFDESRVFVEGTYTTYAGEKSTITNDNLTAFKHNGNTHTATIPLDKNGNFGYQVKTIDKAGNVSEIKTYTDIKIDTIMPEVTITGVQNQQAYANGEESPVVTMTDENLSAENSKVTLVDGFGHVVNEFIKETKNTDSGKKIIVSFNDFSKDGVYTIIAEAYDKAGNLTRNEVEFSVNRNGSTFKIDLPKLINGQYLDKAPELAIYEINVTKINEDNVDILLGMNSVTKTLNHGVDYSFENTSVKGGWNQYKYVVKADNFKEDAEYEISAVSRDNNNHVKSSADTTKLAFILDTTAPTFDTTDLSDDLKKNVDTYTVKALVEDNYTVASIDVKVNGQSVKVDEKEEACYFDIAASDKPQDVSVRVVDGANHVCEKTYKNILIKKDGTLSGVIQNTPNGNDYTVLFSIIGAFAAIAFIVVLIVVKRRKTTVVVRNR